MKTDGGTWVSDSHFYFINILFNNINLTLYLSKDLSPGLNPCQIVSMNLNRLPLTLWVSPEGWFQPKPGNCCSIHSPGENIYNIEP